MNTQHSTPQLVEQRIRNRLVEYLELVASYQADTSPVDGNGLINLWQDWNPEDATTSSSPAPTYTQREAEWLVVVNDALNAFCDVVPQYISDFASVAALPEWFTFQAAAQHALEVFGIRGRLSEDVEINLSDT